MERGKNWVVAIFAYALIVTGCEELERNIPTPEKSELIENASSDREQQEENITSEEEEEPPRPEVIEVEVNPDIKAYLIRQGGHNSALSFREIDLDSLEFKALFDSSAIYKTTRPENQGDINKLWGVSDCGSFHHTNSARFGWRWFNDQLEIWAYTYVNGKRGSAFVDIIELNRFYNYQVLFTENQYIFRLGEKEVSMERKCSGTASGYQLYPYFGGDEKAPHDINILIEEKAL